MSRASFSTGRQFGKSVLVSHLEDLLAESYRNGRRQGREDVFEARRRLVDRDEHACEDCVRDEVGPIP